MKVLLIEDNQNYAFLVEAMLRSSEPDSLSFSWAESLRAGIGHLERESADIILADLSLPDSDGLATVTELKAKAGITPIIVLTGRHDEKLASDALRLGAQDYLFKSEIETHGLQRSLRYAIERQRSDAKYRDLVESLDTIVWEAEPLTWRFTFVSKAAEKMLGYPIERWLETTDFWLNLIHPDDRSAALESCQNGIDSGDSHEIEYRVIAMDGRIVWLRDIVRVTRNASGQPVALRGVMIDISQSKAAAAELQRQHNEIQSLQEISEIVLAADDPNVGIQKALETSLAACGFDFGDVLLTTPQGELASVLAACGFRDLRNAQRTPRPEASTRRRMLSQQSTVIDNIQQGDRHRSFKREGAETALIVPLRAGNERLGLLQFASRRKRNIRSSEVALADAMGRQIGLAIQKSKLTDELSANLKRIQVLYEIDLAVNSTLELNVQIDILLDRILRIFPDYAVTLRLANKENGKFEPLACRGLDEADWKKTTPTTALGGLAEVSRLRRAVQITDLWTDSRTSQRDFMCRSGLHSYLGVPLIFKEEFLGVLGIFTRERHEFSDGEIQFTSDLAEHAATAVFNAQLFTEIEKKSRELGAILDVSTAANRSLNLEQILHEVAQKITEIFAFGATRILLLDAREEELQMHASYQIDELFTDAPRTFKAGQGISGHAAASGEPLVIENIDTDPRYQRVTHARTALRIGQKFAASFPIKYEGKTLGVITCVGHQPRHLTDHEWRLISSMSSQVAVAVHNSRLYAEVEQQSRELSALFDVTTAATQSLEMDQVLEEVIRRVREIFRFDATRFYLFDEQREWLHCRATHQVDSNFVTRTISFKKGQGITGRVGETGAAIVIVDTEADPQYRTLSHAKKTGRRFVAAFPVKYGPETLGVIMCLGDQPRQLSNHEINLIASLSGQIAIALTNARLYEQSKEQATQLRNLATHLESVREQERTRISRELHDELGQVLTGLKFDVAWMAARISERHSSLAPRLAAMSETLDNTIHSIREISARLRPDILDKLGLSAAMEWQLQEFRQRTGINYHFASYPADIRLSNDASVALFRILQEALTNIARHSQANRVTIVIELQGREVFLHVEDDGNGIAEDKIFDGQSLGLLGMRERAAHLGGTVTVRRNHAHGTSVTVLLPIENQNEAIKSSLRSEEL